MLRVKEILRERRLPATWLVRRAGISYGVAHRLASGRARNVSLATLSRVARALGVGVADLFEKEERSEGSQEGPSLGL